MEERGLAKGNLFQQNKYWAQNQGKGMSINPSDLPNAMERVRQADRRDRRLRFTTLWHHVYELENLRTAYFSLKRNAAPGVDGETWRHYGKDLNRNLMGLASKLKRGAYRAKPVKRSYIPKNDGGKRPLGVTSLEDKIVQKPENTCS